MERGRKEKRSVLGLFIMINWGKGKGKEGKIPSVCLDELSTDLGG